MAATSVKGAAGKVETDDVQGLVLQGYGKLRAAAYVVLEIGDQARARTWLGSVLPEVCFGDRRPAGSAVNLAFTAAGLGRLDLDAQTVSQFSLEFLEGMTSAHRSRLLGDQGAAAPAHWSWGGPDGPEVHALLLVFGADEDALAEALDRLRAGLREHGLTELACLGTEDIGRGEHFGFRDGLSQPSINGVGKPAPAMHALEPGEFLLGYRNEHGQPARSPLVPPGVDGSGLPGRQDFGRNGSYLVLRTLEQDVGGFWGFLDEATRRPDGTADPQARTALAARMVGRWPSGAPLTLSPDADRPELAESNDFGYAADDPHGLGCPVGAHVRRTNPRDSLPRNQARPIPSTSASATG